jgi:hypothetical protein
MPTDLRFDSCATPDSLNTGSLDSGAEMISASFGGVSVVDQSFLLNSADVERLADYTYGYGSDLEAGNTILMNEILNDTAMWCK